ncbi:hypothetical protein [Streptomyces vietnamensis]|uniref:hypothetical protein n=1 Tax=Streptomyces vietnamensis TaxID=362257 RepID=UPI00343A408E
MPITDETPRFTTLSARLTGFGESALDATGLTEVYRTVAADRLGAELYARLLHEAGEPDDGMDDELAEAARAVTYLWYTGGWPGPPSVPVSSRAYAEGLVWKASGLTAPASAPGGYGSWAGIRGRSDRGDGIEPSHRIDPGDRTAPGGEVDGSGR